MTRQIAWRGSGGQSSISPLFRPTHPHARPRLAMMDMQHHTTSIPTQVINQHNHWQKKKHGSGCLVDSSL
ncbi:hypothetical protein AMEX_G12871 [Astyanax mexicanus]|uniref:Uncharacterized protein n=1 Tax=Astyanax mexicanus TaxID=7994 RepID=A0A8T2LJF3_ASTMX|nr:hypothetical protein AMEX_G12871 [Astyanax mexicanus]